MKSFIKKGMSRKHMINALTIKMKKAPLKAFECILNPIVRLQRSDSYFESDLKEFNDVKLLSMEYSQINDHLVTLFTESLAVKPKLIVELGVKEGNSTFVFERVAKLSNSKLISVDIEDCSGVSDWKEWIFVNSDDISFSGIFKQFCMDRGIIPEIDILFIDTSHHFDHTVQEINNYFAFLSENGKVFFHDTNMNLAFFRKDGSMGLANDTNRGVISALEKYLNREYNEKNDFIDYCDGWFIKHYAYCNGLTVLTKFPVSSKEDPNPPSI